MPRHFHLLTVREDLAVHELLVRLGSFPDCTVIATEPDAAGNRRIDVVSPTTELHQEAEVVISGWNAEHPGLLIMPDEMSEPPEPLDPELRVRTEGEHRTNGN